MERIPMTQQGWEKLRSELQHIKKVERPQNVLDIETAREHGDLKENAEYHAAKERQGQLEAQMRHLEDQIARAEVIDPAKIKSNKIVFGATVQVFDLDDEKELTYIIVGPPEADIKQNKISIKSPLARALVGKVVQDEVVVPTPKGERNLEILSIKYTAID